FGANAQAVPFKLDAIELLRVVQHRCQPTSTDVGADAFHDLGRGESLSENRLGQLPAAGRDDITLGAELAAYVSQALGCVGIAATNPPQVHAGHGAFLEVHPSSLPGRSCLVRRKRAGRSAAARQRTKGGSKNRPALPTAAGTQPRMNYKHPRGGLQEGSCTM